MKIYTKTGDAGETALFGGHRVSKDDLRIRAYGSFDELNAILGLIVTEVGFAEPLFERVFRLQGELFQLGAELATPRGKSVFIDLLSAQQVEQLEREIDEMEAQLKPLKTFILPGGSRASALLHLARTVSRRAERETITLNRAEPLRPLVLQYINRLSDYFFVMARTVNRLGGHTDVPWIAPRSQGVGKSEPNPKS
ncbi:MAG: cob(I)yrinic acid a,c-diamide adenosyltransferase [Bdellovibrionia bacterium]